MYDNFFSYLTTKRFQRVGTWTAARNVGTTYTLTNSSWLNRIEAQFTALRYSALDGTEHASHQEWGRMIRRRYLIRGTAIPTTVVPEPSSPRSMWPDTSSVSLHDEEQEAHEGPPTACPRRYRGKVRGRPVRGRVR